MRGNIAAMEWLDLPAPPRVVFGRTPLSLVVCQVRYSPMLSVANALSVAPFQEAIVEHFPVLYSEEGQNVSVRVQGDLAQPTAPPHVSVGSFAQVSWRFTDEDDTWTLVLTPETLTLETRAYQDFSDFVKRLEFVVAALAKHIRPPIGLRVGLRYFNEIRPGGRPWADVIRPELLGPMMLPSFADNAEQVLQQILLRPDGDGSRININHGLLATGAVVFPRSGEAIPSGPFYLIDIDAFKEFKPGELAIKASPIGRLVTELNRGISRFFRWAITDAYRESLGRRADVD